MFLKWLCINIFTFIALFFSFSLCTSARVMATNYDLSTTSAYNQKIYGPANGNIGWGRSGDINGDGKADLLIGGVSQDYNGTDSGSVWIIFDYKTKLGDSAIGSQLDLTDTSNFNLRLDGPAAGSSFGVATFIDLNGDGKDELAVSGSATDYNSRTDAGSIYIFSSSFLENYATTTGNTVNTSSSSNYSIRIDGPAAYSYLSIPYNVRGKSDLNSDGKMDLIVKVDSGFDGLSYAGSVYVIYSTLINSLSGTGNTIDLNSSSSYNLRFSGDQANVYMGAFNAYGIDLNNNGRQDLIIEESNAIHSGKTGSLFVVYDSIFSGLTGTGNNLSFATSSSYSIRIDGEAGNQYIGSNGPLQEATDINGDGKNELIIGAPYSDFNSRINSGSLYIINNDILSAYTTTGNSFSVSDATKYNLRIDGSEAYETFSWSTISIGDINNDGYNDISAQGEGTYFNGHYNNRAYIFYNNLLDISSTGRTLNLSNSNVYAHKYEGTSLDSINSNDIYDINGDGSLDYLLTGDLATVNGRAFSGVGYAILNFPHTITSSSTSHNTSLAIVKGTISALKSTTTISGIQYLIDNDSESSSSWSSNGCSADDGSFNSTYENFTCTVSSIPSSSGNHTISFRAYDSNTSYTNRLSYYKYTYRTGDENGNPKHNPQIPQSSVNNSGGVFEPNEDSNTNGQRVVVITEPKTFNFDAYLSANTTTARDLFQSLSRRSKTNSKLHGEQGNGILSILINGNRFYQIGNILQIWYKAYAPGTLVEGSAKIIPELQYKKTIVALSYADSDLILPGRPKSKYNAKKLKLARSLDGITWNILPTSVVDTKNHTIAALDKVYGYYMIVSK